MEAYEILKCFSVSNEFGGDDPLISRFRAEIVSEQNDEAALTDDVGKDQHIPSLIVCNTNVKNTKFIILNDFLLSKVNEADPEKLKEDLTSIIRSYERIVDRISDFSFVVQELNVNNLAVYAQQLVILMLNLVK